MTNSAERYVAACKRAGPDPLLAEAEAWHEALTPEDCEAAPAQGEDRVRLIGVEG